MSASQVHRVGWLFCVIIVPLLSTRAQPNPARKSQISVEQFFQGLAEDYNPASPPKFEDILRVQREIAQARPGDVSRALPALFTALAHPDINVKIAAAAGLLAISLRPDSNELLRERIPDIMRLLDEADGRLQGLPVIVFENFRPPPVKAVLPAFLAFLKRSDRDPRYQAAAVGYVVRHAPENAAAAGAVLNFLDRPLDREARIQVLKALGTPQIRNPEIAARVIGCLYDADPAIRTTAADALSRMSQDALLRAEPRLESLTNDPSQPVQVREAAKRALRRIRANIP